MQDVVSTSWLAKELEAGDLRIVDASQHDFEPDRDPKAEYDATHMPGAVFLDLDTLIDASNPVPNMLPTPELFSQRMRELGIDETHRIVIYDDSVLKTGMRAWFMFRMFGLTNVAFLDGGLSKWKAEGRPVTSSASSPAKTSFTASRDPAQVKTKQDVLENIASKAAELLDGRGAQHFNAEAADPNPVLASGHIPGAINIPFWDLFEKDGVLKSPEDLRALFTAAGADLEKPAITSCGGGVVACALILAMRTFGKEDAALYDGSWNEWGADPELPKNTGAN